ncbi:unnamed protein product [Caenorhabditis auriculariae]|uniref:Uncharacterized protein n=1 Tax=Caenorhabditis auriculariae TaxID=2777116 RepID=A0A8S1HNG2_9PELO|nr:unnamed protein product [Caenorhabditis auriculariae]
MTSSIGSRTAELLVIGSSGVDPNSTIVIDPRTGVSSWSFKGSELQGAPTGNVEMCGADGEHMIVSIKGRPLVHFVGVHPRDRFHHKVVLPGPVTSFCTSSDGKLLLAAIRKQIFVWNLVSGELLSVTDAHYQDISQICLSDDGSLVITASLDGSINVYTLIDLISVDREHSVLPIRKWNSHTLAVRSLKTTTGDRNPRIISCGMDHIACIHSITTDSVIFKVSSDRPLTCCTIDPADSRLFLGTDTGNIAQINLYKNFVGDVLIQTSDEANRNFPILNGHSDEISSMCMNADGNLLASGDSSGRYCIWDVVSHQCLKVSSMRSTIATLKFVPNWPVFTAPDYSVATHARPNCSLQRDVTRLTRIAINISADLNQQKEEWKTIIDDNIERLLNSFNATGSHMPTATAEEPSDDVEIIDPSDEVIVIEEEIAPTIGKKGKKKRKNVNGNAKANGSITKEEVLLESPAPSDVAEIVRLREEVASLKAANERLYMFAASEIIGTRT